ncbi:MAG: hypothetical protein J0M18_16970 [Ignavibacteria bacterium]|nr:hypothetical protein [Ignavibacteria bacterium]
MDQLVDDFIKVCNLSNIKLEKDELIIESISDETSHKCKKLPDNCMAIYIFKTKNEYLKVGKVGPKSRARYLHHHYNPKSSGSNLAKSILKDSSFISDFEAIKDVKNWIIRNTIRTNIIVKANKGSLFLNLFEAFLHCRLKPKYEGKNQTN